MQSPSAWHSTFGLGLTAGEGGELDPVAANRAGGPRARLDGSGSTELVTPLDGSAARELPTPRGGGPLRSSQPCSAYAQTASTTPPAKTQRVSDFASDKVAGSGIAKHGGRRPAQSGIGLPGAPFAVRRGRSWHPATPPGARLRCTVPPRHGGPGRNTWLPPTTRASNRRGPRSGSDHFRVQHSGVLGSGEFVGAADSPVTCGGRCTTRETYGRSRFDRWALRASSRVSHWGGSRDGARSARNFPPSELLVSHHGPDEK